MAQLNQRMPRIDTTRFSMVPRADVPRSTFLTTHTHKTTFSASELIPIHVDEVLPGDVHQGNVTIFARLGTPLFPIMDQLWLETFFFFVPNRILWSNWVKMMGERRSPADSISFTVPQIQAPAGGFAPSGAGVGHGTTGIYDYMGVPGAGQTTAGLQYFINALPLRAYNLIYNEWFRDENLQTRLPENTGDGPDTYTDYSIISRNKAHDYFTSALPWPVKGGNETPLLTGNAPVKGIGFLTSTVASAGSANLWETDAAATTTYPFYSDFSNAANNYWKGKVTGSNGKPLIYADLSAAAGATVNALRLAFQTQRLLERDARSGTRYTELLRSHFGVTPEDARLQRPEYIGGGRSPFQTNAIPQTSATGLTGGTSPLGALGAAATISDNHNFVFHAKEHGYIIGLANVRGEVTYQQGLHRLWTRLTRYDFYWPVFAHLGEQIVRTDEIYLTGNPATDPVVWGYQERWAEYRHRPSRISGLFRSTTGSTIDPWHLAEKFTAAPALNIAFLSDKTSATLARALAAGTQANGMQILFDSLFRIKTTRAMPMFSVPGMIDRF